MKHIISSKLPSIFNLKSDRKDAKELIIQNLKNSKEKPYINYAEKAKHFPPANKEWFNSIYSYNNSNVKPLPVLDKVLAKLVKSHLNLYSNKLKKMVSKTRSRRVEIRKVRRSINKILVSKAELKHTNSKVIITLYVYNAEKKYYLKKLNKISSIYEAGKLSKRYIKETSNAALSLKSKLKDHKKSFYSLIKAKNLKLEGKSFTTKLNSYKKSYMKNFIYKFLRKEIISVYFNQILAFNKTKFEKKYVSLLANEISKIYNKNVEFNFVNLKYLYLDSYIFSTALITKIKKLSRVKKSFMIGIKKFLNMFNIAPVKPMDTYNQMYNKERVIQSPDISDFVVKPLKDKGLTEGINIEYQDKNKSNLDIPPRGKIIDSKSVEQLSDLNSHDILDGSVTKFLLHSMKAYLRLNRNTDDLNTINNYNLVKVFKSTKYKFINGVRIEIAGRLTKRSSAVRSIFKIRNKGNIRNKDSSDKGLSAVMFRGYAKSNLQYNNIHSKVRGGSFGFKGWLSGN